MKNISFTAEISDKRNNDFSAEDFIEKWGGFLRDEKKRDYKLEYLKEKHS